MCSTSSYILTRDYLRAKMYSVLIVLLLCLHVSNKLYLYMTMCLRYATKYLIEKHLKILGLKNFECRNRGKSKMRCTDHITKDLRSCHVSEKDTSNRAKRRLSTRKTDSTIKKIIMMLRRKRQS